MATAVPEIAPTDDAQPEALPTVMDTAVPPPTAPPPAEPTPAETATPLVEATAVSNQACIVSVNAFVYVWQDEQIENSDCDAFAQEGFVLDDGQPVIVLEATPRTVLGPDFTCLTNEFVKVQSLGETAVTGWVLVGNVQPITTEQGCPP